MRLERELSNEEEKALWNLMSECPALRRSGALMDAFRVRNRLPAPLSAAHRFPFSISTLRIPHRNSAVTRKMPPAEAEATLHIT
jgi:hypothetical protein